MHMLTHFHSIRNLLNQGPSRALMIKCLLQQSCSKQAAAEDRKCDVKQQTKKIIITVVSLIICLTIEQCTTANKDVQVNSTQR